MHTDSYFEQGHTHEVCQDYAIHGETSEIMYAVIADGCSSAPKTDVGARILAEAFALEAHLLHANYYDDTDCVLQDNPRYNVLHDGIETGLLGRIQTVSHALALNKRSLQATIVAAVLKKSTGVLRLYMWGDGQIVLRYKNRLVRYRGAYAKNAPFYLSYKLSEATVCGYYEEFGPPQEVYTKILQEDGVDKTYILQESERFYLRVDSVEDLEYVLVTSDGAESFLDSAQQPVDMLPEFYNFRNLNGSFVKRRMARLREQNKKNEITHYDDISVAGIYLK